MPKIISIENKTKKLDEGFQLKYCDTFLTQLRGLMFRSRLGRDEGLILVGMQDSRLESSIHMFFVSFDLTVLWLNSEMKVVDKVLAKSWHPMYFSKQPAKYVVEIHSERWGDFEIGPVSITGKEATVQVRVWSGLRSHGPDGPLAPAERKAMRTRIEPQQLKVYLVDVGEGFQIKDFEFAPSGQGSQRLPAFHVRPWLKDLAEKP